MQIKYIESVENSLVKKLIKLLHNSKFRHDEQQAVVLGEHLLVEAYNYSLLTKIITTKEVWQKQAIYYPDFTGEVCLVSEQIMAKLNVLESASNILGLINFAKFDTSDIYKQDCVVLEHIQDAGNLGTILRAACGAGIKNIILSKNCVDIYNPKVLRASQGIQFALNIICGVDLFDFIQSYNGQMFATTPHSNNSLYAQDLTQITALIFGNEGNGLSTALLSKIDTKLSIPMQGNAESLNLAIAASICMFELSRQRLR